METMIQMFEWDLSHEDKLWKKIVDQSSILKDLGITKAWLPPAYKGHKGMYDSGYGVYDLYDLGTYDQKGSISTKYGFEFEYLQAIDSLKENDIDVIVDVVLNHRLGADATENFQAYLVSPFDRSKIKEEKEIEAWTKFDFPNRNEERSKFKMNKNHFKGIDYAVNQSSSGIYLFKDKTWDHNIDLEHGNYDYLLGADVDLYNPEVYEDLVHWGRWYQEYTNFDGMRLDAVKHIDFKFFPQWLKDLNYNKDMFYVAEYWSADLRALHHYLMMSEYKLNLFDVPLHYNFHEASLKPYSYDMRNIFQNTLVQNQSDYAVSFVDNHDTQKGQSLESWVDNWFKLHAYALILLRNKGLPTVFYGDLFGMKNGEKVEQLDTLLKVRKIMIEEESLDYFDESECIGWTFPNENKIAVIMSNGKKRLKQMYMGKDMANKKMINVLNANDHLIVDEHGIAMFVADEMSVSVYVKVDVYENLL